MCVCAGVREKVEVRLVDGEEVEAAIIIDLVEHQAGRRLPGGRGGSQ